MKITYPRKVRRAGAVALLAAAGLAILAVPGGLAAATPRPVHHQARPAALPYGVSRHDFDLMMAQIPLDKAANQIQLLAAKPGRGHRGFVETRVNDVRHTVTVVWHGRVPADVGHLIARLRGTVSLRVAPARYSLATLTRDLRRALRSPGVLAGYPLNSGSGIHIDVRRSARAMAAAAEDRLAIPVRASLSGGERQQATCYYPPDTAGPGHRCYDISPDFWGGAVIQSQYGFGCTAGFGVHNSAGGLYMLTAAHCAETPSGTYANGITFYNGNKTYTMGQITDVPGTLDGAVIPTSAGHRYYDGPGIYAGDSSFTKAVAGQQGVSVGDSLCESGAFGGVVCGMKVTELNYTDGTWNNMALAASTGGTYSISGDSGGPWFSLAGSSSVYAKGIHHGVTLDIFGDPNGEIFTPISVLSTYMGVTVNTGS